MQVPPPAHDNLDYPPTKDCALLARNAALWLLLAKKDAYWRFCAFGAGAPIVIGEGPSSWIFSSKDDSTIVNLSFSVDVSLIDLSYAVSPSSLR